MTFPSPADSLLVLPENRFAHAAIHAEPPARTVFLHGPSGAGKSALAAQAVDRLLAVSPKARVQHWTGSQFAAEFAEASSNRTIPLFQSLTRRFDLLVLEDVQALEGRPETQVQLLSLTDELLATDCRILWTSRKSPGGLARFLPKLVSRFRGGVLARMRLPGRDSRRLLIEHFARERRISAASAALDLLAEELAVSPRELLGVIEQLAALARHDRRPIDLELARKFLAHEPPARRLTLDDVCRAVARQFGTTVAELRSVKRARTAALPRQCAMFLARELTGSGMQTIGRYFGGRDHSTVVHACHRLAELLESQPDLRTQLDQARYALGAGPPELE